tara:strand:+ start:2644 stop:2832 length:189 start_codon:yes stop_codon:yes gene_type:complete
MDCRCADADCIHRKTKPKPKIFSLNGFIGTQQEWILQQEKIKEMNDWISIFDMLEKEQKNCS